MPSDAWASSQHNTVRPSGSGSAGAFVFYATVVVTLVAGDLARRTPVAGRRLVGAVVSLLGIGVLATGSTGTVSVRGVLLLGATGTAWGLYTAAGRSTADPRVATTGHFLVLAAVIVPTRIGAVSGLRITASGLAWAVVMGAGTTALAYVAWYACQRLPMTAE